MTHGWEDLVARVRGLSARLLGKHRLTEIARARDLIQIAASLDEAYGTATGVVGSAPEQLENAVRRTAARYIRVITRWSGTRARYLAPLFLDEDRRSIRALLRSAAAGIPFAERLSGLVPTPELPARALEELAAQQTLRDAVAFLISLGHPLGAALWEEANRPRPDLLRLDLALNTEYAQRSFRAVRQAPHGDSVRRDLTKLVRETLDLENAATALQLAAQRSESEVEQFFIPHGERLSRAAFLTIASAPSSGNAASLLLRAFRNSPLAPIFRAELRMPFEEAVLRAEQQRAMDAARRAPLGIAPVIAFVVRLRAEVRDLRYIIWRVALGAPPAVSDALVTQR